MCIENKIDPHHGIPYSRYIISWLKVVFYGGTNEQLEDIGAFIHYGKDKSKKWLEYDRIFYGNGKFTEWLKSLGFNDDECREIRELATSGKLELEDSVRKFLKENT